MNKKLLLVVDMQNDFIDGSLGSEQAEGIVDAVRQKIQAYKRENGTVIFTRDTHCENYLQTQEGRCLPVVHCAENTHGWKISGALDTEGAEIWDKKNFGSLELARYIAEEVRPDAIEIVGLCTDICVVVNALILKTALPEIPVTVDANGCAGVTEERHNAALTTMRSCQIAVIAGE